MSPSGREFPGRRATLMYAPRDGSAVRYEVLGHTADAGVKAYGETLSELFENAALGMFSLICSPEKVRALDAHEIALTADDDETLLVDWLTELLYLHETEGVLFSEFRVQMEEGGLRAVARGEALDAGRHELKMNVKAVTYHQLEINEAEGYLTVLFDV